MEKTNYAMLTDYERTRVLMWDYYTGIFSNYNDYMNFKYFNRNNTEKLSGIYRYTIAFFNLIENFMLQQEDKMLPILATKGFASVEAFYNFYFVDHDKLAKLSIVEFTFLQRVATKFMHECGLMNISYHKNPLSALARSQSS